MSSAGGRDSSTTAAATGADMSGGGVDDTASRCELPLPGSEPDSSGGVDTGFKFDVGAPEGATAFPIDCTEVEQELTNLGCEFWAVDLPNDYRGTLMSPPAADQQFAVVIANASSVVPANVSIFVGAGDVPVASEVVPIGGVFEFALEPLNIEPRESSADGLAYRIESDVPVTAYQFNPLDNQVAVYSNDASLLLPVDALGQDYTAVTGNAILLSMGADDPDPVNSGAFISVVAVQDDTFVEISPLTAIIGGPAEATLNRGEVLTVVSNVSGTNSGNLSGSRVHADRPVAVFSGNVATAVPANQSNCCADHIEHQLPPHEAWGTAYAVAPPPSPIGPEADEALYRITGAFEDTALRYCPTAPPGAPETIGPGQTAIFQTSMAFTVEADPDKPFALTQFLQSFQALSPNQPGDPAMLVIPSLGQLQRRYSFAVPAGYAQNFVTIVTRGAPDVTIDGEPVDSDVFAPAGVARGQEHFYASISVGEGAHIIEAEVPVGITVMGFDDAVSYGYPGGSGLRIIAIPPAAG
ncbi:MAG: IgGFc-binding protein [Nannocystaceae bacterium]|nr:IgGFc-binding protein [Nannocystaceae bacterium]